MHILSEYKIHVFKYFIHVFAEYVLKFAWVGEF